MSPVSNQISPELSMFRTYNRADSAVFLKTKEHFGGLSNMAGGFPLKVNGVEIRTSEALYQACRYPMRREWQEAIIEAKSPMTAKMKAKNHKNETRDDWDQERINIMRWCLQVKLALNWEKFSKLLLETGDKDIVEQSWKDDFWGAKPDGQKLNGRNVLGELLTELRESIKTQNNEKLQTVEPLRIKNFKLMGDPIKTVKYEEPPLLQ